MSNLIKAGHVLRTTSGMDCRVERLLGRGGQGEVYLARLHGITLGAAERNALTLLGHLELADRGYAPLKNLSGAEIARVDIAVRAAAMSLIAPHMSSAQPSGALSPVPTAVPPIASFLRLPSSAPSIRARQLFSCAA